MAQRTVTILFGIALVGALSARVGQADDRGALTWRVRTGTDFIGEQFRLIEDDTLNLTTDFRAQLQTRWTASGVRWRDIELDNRLGLGTQALRHDLSGSALWQADSTWGISLRGVSLARYYLDDAGGTRSNFAQGRLQATIERGLFDENSTWGVDQGIEGTVYGDPSAILLSGFRHWHGLVAEGRRAFDFYGGRLVFEREQIPDSTALGYLGLAGDLYGMWSPSLDWELTGDLSAMARYYRNPAVRPHQTALAARLRAGRRILPDWSVEVNPAVSLAAYDRSSAPRALDSIYYDYRRFTPTLNVVWWPSWGSLRAGPTAEWQRSNTFRGENYTEWGGQIGANILSARWGFFDLMTQVGRRNYLHDTEAFFSDYTFWDTTLLLTGYLPYALQMDGFLILRTEHHSDAFDDTRSILLTVDLSRALGR